MATIKLLLGIFCFAFAGSNWVLSGHLLSSPRPVNPIEQEGRTRVTQTAIKEVGVREETGKNDGPRVEEYLRLVGLKKPEPYCAAFVSWVYAKAGYEKPRSGWSPDLFPSSRLARSALPGDVLGIYFSAMKRIAHVGIVIKQSGDYVTSVEGNTNVAGNREGGGVYLKVRHIKTIYQISNWIKKKGEKQ